MKHHLTIGGTLILAVLPLIAGEQAAEEHVRKATAHWTRMEITGAIAEWEAALKADPENRAAKDALAKLEPVFAKTDQFLDVLEALLDKGHIKEVEDAIGRWNPPYTSRDQQARALVVQGRVALARGHSADALTDFASAETAAETAGVRQRAVLGKGKALCREAATRPQGLELLQQLARDAQGTPLAADVMWALVQARETKRSDRITALRAYLNDFPETPRKAEVHLALASLVAREQGGPGRASLEELLAAFGAATGLDDKMTAASRILQAIQTLTDHDTLSWLGERLTQLPPTWEAANPPLELAALAYRRLVSTSRDRQAIAAAQSFLAATDKLLAEAPTDARRPRWRKLAAEALLMEGQLLLVAGRELEALKALDRASGAYQAILRDGDRAAGTTLLRIGRILESRGRPDGAAHHYTLVARAFAADVLGAQSLWRLAEVYRDLLDRPLDAIATLQGYHDLYPPSFRIPTTAKGRILKLGYPDVAGFQATHGLKVDGILGPKTLEALRVDEENFREILPQTARRSAVAGKAVHDRIFGIAQKLRERGRFREAVRAYQVFLSMYPGHRLGDDALLAVARIFRENDLWREAAAAYDRMIVDYPNGNNTTHAYLEAAYCRECLGEWEEAEELYDLFIKKFPHFWRTNEARKKLAALRKLIRYAELVGEEKLPDAKMADARYEMGRLLYKEMDNRQKAVELFADVANRFAKTYHGPDARYSAGVCLLHEQNFAEARDAFDKLAAGHPESRLADDARFWVGHTYEYQARALGKLDYAKIILKKRSAEEADKLRADLELRRLFWPDARDAAPGWHRPHPDILRAGETREKVRDGLHQAIQAYRRVVAEHRLGDMAQKALLRIGAIYSTYLDDPDKAIEAYRELLEKYPGSPEAVDAQFAVGRHYLENDDLTKAEKAVTLFLTSFPNHAKAADALLDLAECHRRQKEWVKTLDDYQSFLNRYPSSPKAGRVREEIEWVKKYRF